MRPFLSRSPHPRKRQERPKKDDPQQESGRLTLSAPHMYITGATRTTRRGTPQLPGSRI